MKTMNKIVKLSAKVIEVLHWLAALTALCAAIVPKWFESLISKADLQNSIELSVYGFELTVPVSDGAVDTKAFVLFAIAAFLILTLMAMVFRNIYLIFKKSVNTTPFQKDNTRMVREIGIFSISVPVIGLIMSTVARLVIENEAAELATSLDGFITGVVILCLSQAFAYGVKLENDIDGLL